MFAWIFACLKIWSHYRASFCKVVIVCLHGNYNYTKILLALIDYPNWSEIYGTSLITLLLSWCPFGLSINLRLTSSAHAWSCFHLELKPGSLSDTLTTGTTFRTTISFIHILLDRSSTFFPYLIISVSIFSYSYLSLKYIHLSFFRIISSFLYLIYFPLSNSHFSLTSCLATPASLIFLFLLKASATILAFNRWYWTSQFSLWVKVSVFLVWTLSQLTLSHT